MLGVEPLLAGVEAGDPGLEGGEVPLGPRGAGERVLVGLGEPADLVVGGGRARAQRVDLAGEPGQPLAAVGGGAVQPGDPALLLGHGVLRRTAAASACSSATRCCSTSASMAVSCSLTWSASASSASGSRPEPTSPVATPSALRTRSAASDWVPRSRSRSPDSANHSLLRLRQRRQVLAQRGLELALALDRRGLRGLDLLAPLQQHGLVGELLVERGARGHQVVGHQPGLGVAQRRLDAGRAAGHLGLAAQRLELAADLGEQVVEAGEVALAGVELAERLLLALAVLEDARGLLDEPAPVLRRRVQDLVELALADDDVHLAADAGVREQLLDVEQPARACR